MFKRKLRLLKDLQISEISAVDRAAAPGARIMLRKRAARAAVKAKLDRAVACLAASVKSIVNDPDCNDKRGMLARSFGQYLAHVSPGASIQDVAAFHGIFAEPRHKNLDVSISEADDDEGMPNERDEDDEDADGSHRAGDTGENGSGSVDQLERAERALKMENTMQTHSEMLSAVAKKYGVHALAKSVAQGDVSCSEHELTKLIDEQAKREGTTFVKLYESPGPEGVTLRKAIMAARDAAFLKAGTLMPIAPTQVGGAAARDVDADKEGDAYQQLVAMAEKMRAASPEMTLAQAFERTYSSPEYKELAELERRQARSRLPITGARVG